MRSTIGAVPDYEIDGVDENGNTLLLLAVQYKANDTLEGLMEAFRCTQRRPAQAATSGGVLAPAHTRARP